MNRDPIRIDPLSSKERLNKLEQIERDLSQGMSSAASALNELSKDKPAAKTVDNHTQAFLKKLSEVECELSKQIHYLTQVSSGQSHEGSSYASQKVLTMAWHRIEHAKTRLGELERMNTAYLHQQQQQQQIQMQQQMQQNLNQNQQQQVNQSQTQQPLSQVQHQNRPQMRPQI